MKMLLFSLFISIGFLVNSQVKKRDQGYYKGVISAYTINTSQNLVKVDSCQLFIQLDKSSILIKIDDQEYLGTYRVNKRKKRNYVLKAKTKYSDIEEEIILFGKDKIMNRKGLFPQPDTQLIKLKKKEVLW